MKKFIKRKTIALEGNGQRPSHHGDGYKKTDKMYTLNSTEVHAVCIYTEKVNEKQYLQKTKNDIDTE